MTIWAKKMTLEDLNKLSHSTMLEHLDMKYVEIGPNSLTMTMPVDQRTKQPYGLLHGGASAALAETVGSIACFLTLENEAKVGVGLDINVSHLKSVAGGFITATATPIRLGSNIQVWEIRIVNDAKELTAFSRLTMMILDRNKKE
mgnify:CR=1 FL=1